MNARLLLDQRHAPPPDLWQRWSSILTHTHMMRSATAPFEQAKRDLVEMCRRRRIGAAGIGSPWEPVSAAHYGQYERSDRDLYYAGRVDPESVMDRESIGRLFEDLNRAAEGRTLFYQDNETPKGRYGHLWYFGYHYDVPAWHDYDQDRPMQYYARDPQVEINALTGQPHRRRPALEIVAAQRKAGAVAVWAHPTSWWQEKSRPFVTNIASEAGLHLLADGRLDGMVVQGYDACHRSYQALWFHLLDTGAIVPGFGESDAALDSGAEALGRRIYRTCLRASRPLDTHAVAAAARTGEAFATSSAFLAISVDDVPMGRIVESGAGRQHRLRIEAYPAEDEAAFSRLDVIGSGGTILASVSGFTGGVLEFGVAADTVPAYVLARAFGEHDDPDAPRQQSIRHMAITNPVYLHASGFAIQPATTQCSIRMSERSPWLGGKLTFETAAGELLEEYRLRAGTLKAEMPASARVALTQDGQVASRFYVAMENESVQALLRYLHNGEFLRDHPTLEPGEVPPSAFRLDELRAALANFTTEL